MPTYTIKNNDDGKHFDTVCTYDELQTFLEEHPAFTKVITAPNIVSGIAGKTHKVDDGFKENMSMIAEAHPNSPMAQTYGSNRNHKEIKTYNAITKHAKSIGKSHDLNAISQEYKQGQLVK